MYTIMLALTSMIPSDLTYTCFLISAICQRPCANGGKCAKPNKCRCKYGYKGAFCETKFL